MLDMIDAYWFARREDSDGLVYAGNGNEPGWRDGEERTVDRPEDVEMCSWGYHAADSWLHSLWYAKGPIACRVRLAVIDRANDGKFVGPRRTLVSHVDASHELRLAAADFAERALLCERKAEREPDLRLWRAVAAIRQYAMGEISNEALQEAADAAADVAVAADAAFVAAFNVSDVTNASVSATVAAAINAVFIAAANAVSAPYHAAYAAIGYVAATDVEERSWQSDRLNFWIDRAFARKENRVGG